MKVQNVSKNKKQVRPLRNILGFYPHALRQLLTDYAFTCDTYDTVRELLQQPKGNQIFHYVFNAIPTNIPYPKQAGSAHGYDMWYFFGMPLRQKESSGKDKKLAFEMIEHLSSFVKRG